MDHVTAKCSQRKRPPKNVKSIKDVEQHQLPNGTYIDIVHLYTRKTIIIVSLIPGKDHVSYALEREYAWWYLFLRGSLICFQTKSRIVETATPLLVDATFYSQLLCSPVITGSCFVKSSSCPSQELKIEKNEKKTDHRRKTAKGKDLIIDKIL